MSIIYCPPCDKNIDTDEDVDHKCFRKSVSLSDKIIWDKNSGFGQGNRLLDVVDVKDVKEFIKLIEEEMHLTPIQKDRLDKLVGDKLK